MNAAAEMNKDMSRSFFRFGLVTIAVMLAIIIAKSFLGYESVHKVKTLGDCKVNAWSEYHHYSRNSSCYYYVKVEGRDSDNTEIIIDYDKLYDQDENYDIYSDSVSTEERKTIFYSSVPYLYYSAFSKYDDSRVTFYATSWGRVFPVYKLNCSKAEAEREYRRLDPPFGWYAFYLLGLAAGAVSIYLGLNTKKAAMNYGGDRVYEQPVQFENTQDALAAMATRRIRREKMEENIERGNRYRRF